MLKNVRSVFNFLIPFIFATILFFLFVFKANWEVDPDFGWRLRSGWLYLSQGIPKNDPFSYTMPSFPWVDHAYLISTLFGLGYLIFGKLGLSLFVSIEALLALFVSVNLSKRLISKKTIFGDNSLLKKINPNYISLILGTQIVFLPFGIRAQITSWLMLSLFLLIYFSDAFYRKWKMLIPFFFFVWTNLHGSYLLGLMLYLLMIVVRSIELRKYLWNDYIILLLSVILVNVNPYGISLWREVWSSVSDNSLRFRISEWQPAIFSFSLTFYFFMVLSIGMVIKNYKKFKTEALVIYIFLLSQSLLSRRHIPLWILIAIPMTSIGIWYFYNEIKASKESVKRFNASYKFIFALTTCLAFGQFFLDVRSSSAVQETAFYPVDAVNFLKTNPNEGNIFSSYGWGGYLIWKYPEKKVFSDGRMPSWKFNAPNDEENSAFDTQYEIQLGKKDYKEIFAKYEIDTVLWTPDQKLDFMEYLRLKGKTFVNTLGIKQDEDYNFTQSLLNDGWKIRYKDSISVIYRK